ncbi:ATP-binding cassette domain-containing protein [Streptomyces sedi]|uniref:ATP-binding cassette domain-containing protein n=1 Tax=Streptomyces sedi TaxID=555059 RepID=A0A5C4VEQ0_9ACTN|nr:ATP-binding cassette domain-containing protein [Streptomyces sedi]TNM34400.1 ATP-binding cassette domain-containing protein [Streptomyces sedi]
MTDHVSSSAISARGLTRRFGSRQALAGVDLSVPAGTVMGLLGPNGAGKSTVVRVLSTLLLPDSGTARVAGHDVLRAPEAVRGRIGLSGQYAAVDPKLTARENLYLVARLYGMRRRQSRRRADELLERFALGDVADQLSGAFSGGTRRRLDLAGALVARPPVVVLDEPTTGLDPRGRADTWRSVRELVDGGTTVLLTTQYLEEADHLADSIAVIDRGRVIARGTAAQLKAAVGGERLSLTVPDPGHHALAWTVLASLGPHVPEHDPRTGHFSVATELGAHTLEQALAELRWARIRVHDVTLAPPTLDDAFLALTGRPPTAERPPAPPDDAPPDTPTAPLPPHREEAGTWQR